MEKLTESEIRRRMIEWRNLKVLHKKAVARNDKLKRKLENAGIEISALKQIVREQAEMIEVLRLQVEELKQMVFGRKKKKDDDDDNLFNPKKEKKKPKKRNKDSYKRPTPDATDITAHKHHVLETSCPDCGSNLENKETGEFYEEDIPLPDKKTKLKQVIKHYVEKGYCPSCRKWHTAFPLPYANVVLGNKIKLYISYLSILLRLSFSQIRSLLWDTYHFKISDGEIAKVLHKSADKLKPAFEKLRKKLQTSKGVHLDETTWSRGLYLWVIADVEKEDVLYMAGKSRGKGNADELLGEKFLGLRITDAYAAYKNQPGPHQQCWSHPHTKLKQLAYSKILREETRRHCHETYSNFEEIYAKLRGYIKEPFKKTRRAKQKRQLVAAIKRWRQHSPKDPKRLHDIKRQFHDYLDEWITCMDYDGMPCDNNKAERKLRHFVIKRKISFGNKSQKGHETFSILASVLMSCWKTHHDNFFPQLQAISI